MSKVLSVLALSLLATTAANAMSSRHHSSYTAIDHQSDSRKDATDPTTPAAAPEIDPASAISAFTLLAGGLAVIRGRRAAPKRD